MTVFLSLTNTCTTMVEMYIDDAIFPSTRIQQFPGNGVQSV